MAQLGPPLNRLAVTDKDIEIGLSDLSNKLLYRLEKKGYGAYASRHEVLGIVAEEYKEVLDEIQDNTALGYTNFKKELLDVAVAAIFGYICLNGGYIKVAKP